MKKDNQMQSKVQAGTSISLQLSTVSAVADT